MKAWGNGIENASLDNLSEIKDIAQDQLRKIQLQQGQSQTEVLQRINDTLSRSLDKAGELLEMIQHFRAMSGMRADRIEPAETRMQGLVDQVLRAMQYTFPLQRITILKAVPHDLNPVHVPKEHLETILFHLIHFARHEINGNVGIVSIAVAECEGKAEAAKPYHDIRISYHFQGLRQGDESLLFDPFYEREDRDQSARFGLFIARKLVEHHGGTIRLCAAEKGNTFYLEFPTGAQN